CRLLRVPTGRAEISLARAGEDVSPRREAARVRRARQAPSLYTGSRERALLRGSRGDECRGCGPRFGPRLGLPREHGRNAVADRHCGSSALRRGVSETCRSARIAVRATARTAGAGKGGSAFLPRAGELLSWHRRSPRVAASYGKAAPAR